MVCKTIIGGSIPPRASNLLFALHSLPIRPIAVMERPTTVFPDITPRNRSKIGTSPANGYLLGIFAYGSNWNASERPKGLNRMKKLIFLLVALSVFAIPSPAQSVDASLSYSYFRLGGSGGINQNGVSGSVAYNPNRWLGIVGDFGGYHASPLGVSVNTYTYLFGPRLTLRNPSKINPFAQALFGGSRITVGSGGGSNNQFAYSFGGGVDIGMLPHLALRPQVDYIGLNTPGSHTNCTRVSAGFVVHF